MTGRGKLSDAELSKKLGHYQKMSRIWILVGLFGALSGTVSYFAVQDTALKAILTGVLFFGGVCCAVFLGGSAQKKLQALIQEQFGDFFRAEWEKAFGPDMHTPEMCVDEPFLRTFHLLDGQWEECTVENFHEGDWLGVRKTVIAEKQLFYGICQTGLGEQKIPQREQSTPCGNFLLFYFLPFLCLELALPRCRCMGFFKCLDFFNTEIIVTSSSFVQES